MVACSIRDKSGENSRESYQGENQQWPMFPPQHFVGNNGENESLEWTPGEKSLAILRTSTIKANKNFNSSKICQY